MRRSQSQGNRDKKEKGKEKKREEKEGREEGKKRKIPSSPYIIEPIIKVYCLVPWDHRERLCEARGSNSKKLHFLELVHFSTFTERPVCTRQLSGKTNMLRMTPPTRRLSSQSKGISKYLTMGGHIAQRVVRCCLNHSAPWSPHL